MARAERKRVKDLVSTLKWSVPELEPRAGTLPPNPDGLEECAELDLLPGIRVVLFPHDTDWRALVVQFDGMGRVTSTMEHQSRASSDEEAPAWSVLVFRDLLSSVVAANPSAALPQERLSKIEGLVGKL